MIDALAASPLAHAVGFALVHFLWQGAILGAACAVLLGLCRHGSAQTRYNIGCATMAAMVVVVVATVVEYVREFSIVAPLHPNALPLVASSAVATAISAPSTTWLSAVTTWMEGRWPIVVLTWSAGVLVLSVQWLRGWRLVGRLRRDSSVPLSADMTARGHALAGKLGIRRRLRFLESL